MPFPALIHARFPAINWPSLLIVAAACYYLLLSRSLAIGSLLLMLAMLASVALLERAAPGRLPWVCVSLFVLAWIGQFVGHAIEGQRPIFFRDLQFLPIGPIWLLSNRYRRFGIPV